MSRRTCRHPGCSPCVKRSDWIDCDGSWNVIASRIPKIMQVVPEGRATAPYGLCVEGLKSPA
jgi:hypothetical protein